MLAASLPHDALHGTSSRAQSGEEPCSDQRPHKRSESVYAASRVRNEE